MSTEQQPPIVSMRLLALQERYASLKRNAKKRRLHEGAAAFVGVSGISYDILDPNAPGLVRTVGAGVLIAAGIRFFRDGVTHKHTLEQISREQQRVDYAKLVPAVNMPFGMNKTMRMLEEYREELSDEYRKSLSRKAKNGPVKLRDPISIINNVLGGYSEIRDTGTKSERITYGLGVISLKLVEANLDTRYSKSGFEATCDIFDTRFPIDPVQDTLVKPDPLGVKNWAGFIRQLAADPQHVISLHRGIDD